MDFVCRKKKWEKALKNGEKVHAVQINVIIARNKTQVKWSNVYVYEFVWIGFSIANTPMIDMVFLVRSQADWCRATFNTVANTILRLVFCFQFLNIIKTR